MKAHVNGVELFYVTYGSGRPLLMMHGGLGADHTYFRLWFDELSDQAELIYYDHRANGRSARPESLADVTHETWAADADALRAHLGHDKIILLGHSYGGFLAQEYALRYGDHLDGLILVCTAPVFDYAEKVIANATARATTPDVMAGVSQALSPEPIASDEAYGQVMDAIAPLYFKRFDQEVAAKTFEHMIYSAAAWNHVNTSCLPQFNALPRLGEITVPTLVISGREDWITPPAEGGERIHKAIPNSRLAVFEESGHYPFIEEHEQFIQIVREFIAGLD